MARPSKLTDRQWAEIGRRLSAGESQSSLAREFKVSQGLISDRYREKIEQIKSLATQVVELDQRIDALPVSDRASVLTLVDQLKGISTGLAQVASDGVETGRYFGRLAKKKASKLTEDSDPDEIRTTVALQEGANRALIPATNLLAANKDSIKPEADAGLAETIRKARLRVVNG